MKLSQATTLMAYLLVAMIALVVGGWGLGSGRAATGVCFIVFGFLFMGCIFNAIVKGAVQGALKAIEENRGR